MKITDKQRQNFLAKLEPQENGCLNYTGYREVHGYGLVAIKPKTIRSHRMAYIIAHGNIPDGLHVLHKCNNPACCNPEHLYAGTNSDNLHDQVRAGNRGKLNPLQVRVILRLAELGMPQREIAKFFSVSQYPITSVIKGKTYKSFLE